MTISYIIAKIFKKIRGSAIVDSVIHHSSKIEAGSNIVNLKMGKYSFSGYDCEIYNAEIGNYCSIANNVVIGGAAHPTTWVSMSPVFYKGRDSISKKFSEFEREPDKTTLIGHDVWIGQYVLIKQGLNIGTGAVIGMGSVVTKDVPPYEIWAGNPAKFIRKRFDDQTIASLLQTKWWVLPDKTIAQYATNVKDVRKFLASFKK